MSPIPRDAKTIQAEAAEWLADQYYTDSWSETDQSRLDAWLAQDLANEVAYWRLHAAWERTNRLAALRPRLREPTETSHIRPHRFSRFVVAGAIFAIVFGLGVFVLKPAQTGVQAYVTQIGAQKSIVLTDGSQITLNTDTSLRLDVRNGMRKVWLDRGEAYFDIHHDALHPFVVIAAGHRITDLGTKFSVRNSSDGLGLRVELVEGRAELDSVDTWVRAHRVMLLPGDVAIADAHNLAVAKQPIKQLAESLEWRSGMLVFRHTTLKEAVDEFNRYNAQKLAIADEDVARLRIAGSFEARNTELFTEAVKELFKLRVSKSENQIVISR